MKLKPLKTLAEVQALLDSRTLVLAEKDGVIWTVQSVSAPQPSSEPPSGESSSETSEFDGVTVDLSGVTSDAREQGVPATLLAFGTVEVKAKGKKAAPRPKKLSVAQQVFADLSPAELFGSY